MIVLTAALVAGCAWERPGFDPYRGPVAEKVARAADRYKFDQATKDLLVSKAKTLNADAMVTITRDGLHSTQGEASGLRDMHYGADRMCPGPVVHQTWAANHTETAFVYCARGECIAIPVVCGNVSRIQFVPTPPTKEPEFKFYLPPIRTTPPTPTNKVPEPGTLALVAMGLVTLLRRPTSVQH